VVLARVGALGEEAQALLEAPPPLPIRLATDRRDEIAYENLTLEADDGSVLVRDLTVTVPSGLRVFVTGANAAAKSALLRASAGIWQRGSDTIARPPERDVLFVVERPYPPPATLREVLVRTREETGPADARLMEVLASLGLESVPGRAQGLDTE
jgi:putative ATP-binding cassette transporter